MIRTENINGSPAIKPESYTGVHSDSEWFYFFETAEEHKAFIDALPTPAITPEATISPALAAVMSAPPEDIAEIRRILGIS